VTKRCFVASAQRSSFDNKHWILDSFTTTALQINQNGQ